MHDAITLEEKGLPTAVIVTTAFLHEAQVQKAALGMEALHPVVIQHPLSTLSNEAIKERAQAAVSQIKKVLLAQGAG